MSVDFSARRTFLPKTEPMLQVQESSSEPRVPHPDEFRRFSDRQQATRSTAKAPGWKSRLAAAALSLSGGSFTQRSPMDAGDTAPVESPIPKTQTVMDAWGTHIEPLRNHHKDDMTGVDARARMARADERRRYIWENTTKVTNPEEVVQRTDHRDEHGDVTDITLITHQERARTTLELEMSKPYADLLHAAAAKEVQRLFEKTDAPVRAIGGVSSEEAIVTRVDLAIISAVRAATVEARQRGMKGVNPHEGELLVMGDFARGLRAHFERYPASMRETVGYFQAVLARSGDFFAFVQSVEASQGRRLPNLTSGHLYRHILQEQFLALTTDNARLEFLRDESLASPASVRVALEVDATWFVRHRQQLREDSQIRRTMFFALSSGIEASYREHQYERAEVYERLLRYLQR